MTAVGQPAVQRDRCVNNHGVCPVPKSWCQSKLTGAVCSNRCERQLITKVADSQDKVLEPDTASLDALPLL